MHFKLADREKRALKQTDVDVYESNLSSHYIHMYIVSFVQIPWH